MSRITRSLAGVVLLVVAGPAPAAELDANGCRVLSKLPAAGVHPRVFFTADEYPRMRKRLSEPHFKAAFETVHRQAIANVRATWGDFAKADLSEPDDEMILRYFTSGEGRNINWGVASVTAVLNDDAELKALMRGVIVNYARIILASRKRAQSGDLAGASAALRNRLQIWKHDRFDVGVAWTFGAAGLAVSYDVLYPSMSAGQRDVVRSAIAAATRGRKSYGNGMPRGFASSNHYGYHGDLAVMLASIEGEPGFDRRTWDGIVQVLTDYWDVAFTRFGVSREDGYGPNLGLRGGGRGFMALARRGHDIFATGKYRNVVRYIAMEYDPYPGGHFNGGASGGPYGELYPTSTLIARYMYPESPVANFIYRHLIGEKYQRRLRWQGLLDYLLYGADWKGPAEREAMLESCKLPLSVFYPIRGKFIARSDWSSDGMYVTFDARPDAHLIGHDKVDRGNFSMSALGRVWAFSGDFHAWDQSRENSLVHVDGKAQAWKAPSVRFLWHERGENIASAAADLKYAYDWQWSPPWPRWGARFDPPWEPETRGPLDLGWPAKYADPDVCPKSIHGSQTGYGGRNNLHRRPYNPVRQAIRSVALVRGRHSYMLVCDDIRKDDDPHRYEWVMQLPLDLEEASNDGNEIVLKEADGDRRLLVRFLQGGRCTARVESYGAYKHPKSGQITHGKRLVASITAVEPGFQVMLYPFRSGQRPPATVWSAKRTTLSVRFGDQTDALTFSTSAAEGTKVQLAR